MRCIVQCDRSRLTFGRVTVLCLCPGTIRGWNILAVSARFYRVPQASMAAYGVLQCLASVRFRHIPCDFYELPAVSVCFRTFPPYSVVICPGCTKDAQCQLEATAGPGGPGLPALSRSQTTLAPDNGYPQVFCRLCRLSHDNLLPGAYFNLWRTLHRLPNPL